MQTNKWRKGETSTLGKAVVKRVRPVETGHKDEEGGVQRKHHPLPADDNKDVSPSVLRDSSAQSHPIWRNVN